MSRRFEGEQGPLAPDDLLAFFTRAEKPDISKHRIGTELETFGVHVGTPEAPTDMPTPVRFADHVEPVLQGLVDRHGWTPGSTRGTEGQLVELTRDGASITLEPGGQVELSGKPLPTIHNTCAEFTQHYREMHDVSSPLGVCWMAAGYHPWATRDEIDWVPKGRYKVMREYLPTRGSRALDMMIRTCTIQANFDYRNEKDCGELFKLALAVGPLVTALFANSPHEEGGSTSLCSTRTAVWYDVDPDRCGIPAFMFDGGTFSYQRYVDWVLDVPMFFVRRGGHYHAHHVPFRQYIKDGFTTPDGVHHCATKEDWELHLSTVFPEVRLKPFVEVRTADSVPSKYVCGLPALWKGILYDGDAHAQACAVVEHMTTEELAEMWVEARRVGMQSKRIREMAGKVLAAARVGLDRQDVRDRKGRTEARFLDPLEKLVRLGISPAAEARRALGTAPGRSAEARLAFARHYYFAGAEPWAETPASGTGTDG